MTMLTPTLADFVVGAAPRGDLPALGRTGGGH